MIRTLTIEQLEGMVAAGISGWITMRAKQAYRLGRTEDLGDMIREVPF